MANEEDIMQADRLLYRRAVLAVAERDFHADNPEQRDRAALAADNAVRDSVNHLTELIATSAAIEDHPDWSSGRRNSDGFAQLDGTMNRYIDNDPDARRALLREIEPHAPFDVEPGDHAVPAGHMERLAARVRSGTAAADYLAARETGRAGGNPPFLSTAAGRNRDTGLEAIDGPALADITRQFGALRRQVVDDIEAVAAHGEPARMNTARRQEELAAIGQRLLAVPPNATLQRIHFDDGRIARPDRGPAIDNESDDSYSISGSSTMSEDSLELYVANYRDRRQGPHER